MDMDIVILCYGYDLKLYGLNEFDVNVTHKIEWDTSFII